jgi:protein-S-isoprenylcysteine O-methyltransferase Ste14
MTSGHVRGALAGLLNAIVLVPALWISDASLAVRLGFFVLISAFAWLEAHGGEALDLADEGFPWSALATALTMLAVFWLAALMTSPVGPGLIVLGASSMAVGIALRHRAMATLGSGFVSEVRVAPRLVERGIYGHMRHPSETGLLALTFGAALLFGSVVAGVVWALVLVPLVVHRIRAEDRELRICFGSAHADYCRRVRAL